MMNARDKLVGAGLAALLWSATGCDGVAGPGSADEEPGRGAAAKGQEVASLANALTDSFTTLSAANVKMAFDGGDRILIVWEASTAQPQIVGQVFSASAGTPLSPSRVYTSGSKGKFQPYVAYGGGKFLVTYILAYGTGPVPDDDVMGLFIRTDGTLENAFTIDGSLQDDNLNGGLVYLPSRSEFYATYYRTQQSGQPDGGGRGNYVALSGSSWGHGYVAGSLDGFLPRVAHGANNIMLAWSKDTNVYRGHMTPGQTSVQQKILLGPGHGPSLAYNPTLHKFGLTYREASGKLRTQTVPDSCMSGTCAGLSPLQLALDPAQWGLSNSSDGEIVAVLSRFVVAMPWGQQNGNLATMSLDTDAWPRVLYTNGMVSSCDRPTLQPGITVGSRGLFGASNFCPNTPKLKGYYFEDQAFHAGEFAISD
jgi:hypothetical protein